MRIAIMGSGGIGGYIGAKLAQASEDVTFIARGKHLAAMQAQGLRVESPLGEIKLHQVSATDKPADVGFVEDAGHRSGLLQIFRTLFALSPFRRRRYRAIGPSSSE